MDAQSIIVHRLRPDPLEVRVQNLLARSASFSNCKLKTMIYSNWVNLIKIMIIFLRMDNSIWITTNFRNNQMVTT